MTTTDNDSAGITITENGGGNVVGEAGSTDTFTVRLNTKPSSGTVLIGLSSSDPEEITVSPDNLTFDNNTWSTAKTVTLTGVNDDVDDGDQNSLILVDVDNGSTTDSNYSNLPTINVGVTTTDNDTSGFTVIESGGTSVAESGTTDTFTVVLNSEPTGNVVLDIESTETGEATVSPASITFDNTTWDTAQTITVTGVNDDEADGNQVFDTTIAINTSLTADSLYDALSDQTVSVTVTDDDAVGYTISESSTDVSESRTTDTFTIRLDSQPNTRVQLNFTSLDTDEFSVSPVGHIWTDSDWNTAKTVTVTGVADDQDDGNQTGTLRISVGSDTNDVNYSALRCHHR